jgi:hypothetical protein
VLPVQGLQFSYAFHELEPGRFPFRRWRWELWHGATLHATGWCGTPAGAERALRTYAARNAHRFFGLGAPGPEAMPELSGDILRPGATLRVSTGRVDYVLVPRGLDTGTGALTSIPG